MTRYTISVGLLGIGFGIVIAVGMETIFFPFGGIESIMIGLGVAAGLAIVVGIIGMGVWFPRRSKR